MTTHNPLEEDEMRWFFQWVATRKKLWPELNWIHHIPNGGSRDVREARKLKAQGVRPGVSDIFLPCARGGHFGLYIEMKRRHKSSATQQQREFLAFAKDQGYMTAVAKGFGEAINIVDGYMRQPRTKAC